MGETMNKNNLAKAITSIIKKAQGETFGFNLSEKQKKQLSEAGEELLNKGLSEAKQEVQQTGGSAPSRTNEQRNQPTEGGASGGTGKQPGKGTGSSLLSWLLGIGGLAGGGILAYKYRGKWVPPVKGFASSLGAHAANLLRKRKTTSVSQSQAGSSLGNASLAPTTSESIPEAIHIPENIPEATLIPENIPEATLIPENIPEATLIPENVPEATLVDTPASPAQPSESKPVATINTAAFLEPTLVIDEEYRIRKSPTRLYMEISGISKDAWFGTAGATTGIADVYRDQANEFARSIQVDLGTLSRHAEVDNFARLLILSKTLDVISEKPDTLNLDKNADAKRAAQLAPLHKFELIRQNYLSLASLEAQASKHDIKGKLVDVIQGKAQYFQFFGIKDGKLQKMQWHSDGTLEEKGLNRSEVGLVGTVLQKKADNLREGIGKLLQHFRDEVLPQRRMISKEEKEAFRSLERDARALSVLSAQISTLREGVTNQQISADKGSEDLARVADALHKINRRMATSQDISTILRAGRDTLPFVDINTFSRLQHGEIYFKSSATGLFRNLDGIKVLAHDVDIPDLSSGGRRLNIPTFAIERPVSNFRMHSDVRVLGFLRTLAKRR
jgi:hypothetical protein